MRPKVLLLAILVALVTACGGTTTRPTASSPGTVAPPASVPISSASPAASGATRAEALCALLGADDFGQFGFVTAAQPGI